MRRRVKGFTLIEVMIVVVIVAILAAVALPSYQQYIRKAVRAAAQGFMLQMASKEEQFILDQRSYTGTIGTGGLALSAPSETDGKYLFTIALTGNDCNGTALVAPSYVITATVQNGPQQVDGDLCLDKVGNKTPIDKWR
jgi:type IV pilus assembly protein PilE